MIQRAWWLPVLVVMTAVRVGAQAPAPAQSEAAFEVVSIKPNDSGTGSISLRNTPNGSFTLSNGTLSMLIGQAFPFTTRDVVGLPDWAASAHFDVNAAVAAGQPAPTLEQRRAMMQAMLADRFKLATHVETRELPVYDLVLARKDGKLGPNLTATDIDCDALAAARRAAADAARAKGEPPPPPTAVPFTPNGPVPPCSTRFGGNTLEGHMKIATLALSLRSMTERQVIDKTGLTGFYNIRLESSTPAFGPQPAASNTPGDLPSIFTAVQEQLGLKLEPSRAPLEVLVIDHVERPTEN